MQLGASKKISRPFAELVFIRTISARGLFLFARRRKIMQVKQASIFLPVFIISNKHQAVIIRRYLYLSNKSETNIFSNSGGDLAAGLVVFFVALPLCLGIALASGAPLFSGIVAGIIGGIVIGTISKSQLSVSGPAAGLAAIVLVAITDLGAFNIFLCAVIIAGVFQLILGFLKAGSIANYLPSNVIEGMLAGIGIIIILKQIPHAVGFDKDYEGNESFSDPAGGNTFSDIAQSLDFLTFGAVIISLVSVAIILSWDKIPFVKNFKAIPSALVAVVIAVILNEVFISSFPALSGCRWSTV
jgi:MFS superfamily sulfate permease-like transporter